MTKHLPQLLLLALLAAISGCSAVEGIFKAGVWWGVFVVVFVIGIIFWLFSRSKK
jgi:hypothetical protein